MSWFWVIMSGVFESLWNMALKKSAGIYDWKINIVAVIFLAAAIITFKKALDQLPLSIAIAVWSGISILLTILLDMILMKSRIDARTGVCMVVCIASIIGMNYFSSK